VTGTRTKRIIAVFGGSNDEDVLALAEELGRAIGKENQVLLTGGTSPARAPVKNRAILGAGSWPWIGVDRKRDAPAEWSRKPERGFVITSDLDHKRNYLEALMCDAAVVVEGGKGTRSELTSALSLHRPVALVGDYWKSVCDTLQADRSRALDSLLDATFETFDGSRGDNDAFDSDLTREAMRSALNGVLTYKCFGSQTSATDVLRWIKSVVADDESFRGRFPVDVHEEVAEAYEKWLTENGT
jgi:predicted Rossmann-fold nucleotide-binding protein